MNGYWKKTTLSNLPEGATFDFDIGIQTDKEITFSMSPVNETKKVSAYSMTS